MRRFFISLIFLFLVSGIFAQPIPEDSLYLGQTRPTNTVTIFQLPTTTGLRPVERIAISSDGKEIYYSELNRWPATNCRIKCFRYVNNAWQGPAVVFEGFVAPGLSPNDSIIYMQKDVNSLPTTFYATRTATGWTTPVKLFAGDIVSHYFQKTNLNNHFLSSLFEGSFDLSQLITNNNDTIIQNLGVPLNTVFFENDFYIARNESYIILFRLTTPYDLFISYKKENNTWTNPKLLGVNINTPIYECSPFVTQDNKYLFFTKGGNSMSSYYTCWVKIDNVIDSLRHTNFVPYVKNEIEDKETSIGDFFSLVISDSTFIDDDGNNTLTYSVTQIDNSPLPSWLTFNATTKTLSGIPTEMDFWSLKVTVSDQLNETASCEFNLSVLPEILIPEDSLYLGQTPPGNIPQIFHLAKDSNSFNAERITISENGKEIFYSHLRGYYPVTGAKAKFYKYSDNKWNGPFLLAENYNAPTLSITDDTLYTQSPEVWGYFSVRNNSGWNPPQRFLPNFNSVHYFQVTNSGNHYVSTILENGVGAADWCKTSVKNSDTIASSLGLPLNSPGSELDFAMAKDESFMIISAGAIKVSFPKSNGKWTNPKSLGSQINFGLGMWGTYISSDNKYLFYTTGTKPDYSDTEIYWVKIDNIVDSLRHTNFVPYVNNKVVDQKATAGHYFSVVIPDSVFIDDDGNNSLIYSLTKKNGSALPTWLTFNATTRTLSGIPPATEILNLKLTGKDSLEASAFCDFKLNVIEDPAIPQDSLYLAQTRPNNSPTIFQLPTTTGLRPAERIAISSNGKEIYYSELDTWPAINCRIKLIEYFNNTWHAPVVVFEGFVAPALSPNDSIMYIQKDVDSIPTTFSAKRTATGWETPKKLLATNIPTHYFQKTNLNNYFLASIPLHYSQHNFELCKLRITNNDSIILNLDAPVNTAAVENDFYIARDESYIILFRLKKPFDLFISYKKENNTWTNPKSLGVNINTPIYECSPFVTKDNKYLFFTKGGNTMASYSTYWVKIDNVIDSLKHTNFVPYQKYSILNRIDTVGQAFSFTYSDSLVIDDDGNNTLTYSATLSDGKPLPSWLNFNAQTRTFSGTPTNIDSLNIKLTAVDTKKDSVNISFSIKTVKKNWINNVFANENVKIYPNPTKDKFNISFDTKLNKNVIVEVSNVDGKLLLSKSFHNISETTIDLTGFAKGIYILKLNVDGKIFSQKIFLE